MKRRFFALCLTLLALPAQADWFIGNEPLVEAHKALLANETEKAFDAMVETWQQQPSDTVKENLANLLSSAITDDCGRNLSKLPLPIWLTEITLVRETVQTPSRRYYRVALKGQSEQPIERIILLRWPHQRLLDMQPALDEQGRFEILQNEVGAPLNKGLYQLTLLSESGESWQTWILITNPPKTQRIAWASENSWHLRPELPRKSCPGDRLLLEIFTKEHYHGPALWQQSYAQGDMPTTLPKTELSSGRYWVTAGLYKSRWQGAIQFQEVQRIARPWVLNEISPSSELPEGSLLSEQAREPRGEEVTTQP
ncbi:hypothetical protein VST7929_03010 [Vibrio stylophorae]|uniref:DUF2861 family protein n=1 Tax=Vibrio stylophorae TaxID=659351 RepID=A0ABM8ZXI3_9VIBR|nr:DUF2861 family protein [Vibrio stylophorae]CAH0535436.1 hypothetical protein VST7929_03010 [Vibrio stylophorae]